MGLSLQHIYLAININLFYLVSILSANDRDLDFSANLLCTSHFGEIRSYVDCYFPTQESPHLVLPNLRISLDIYSRGKVCILGMVLRHRFLKSMGVGASAGMQSGRLSLTFIPLNY